ncbi:hypothetical protein GEMRC1_011703 [Eukaryota sp. GEM-RC1]
MSSNSKIPGIISEDLILGETASDSDPLRYDITSIALSFKNLHEIANLQPFTNVRSLKLDNNYIKTIQNLDHLHNLESLNLSFNEIETISGLENLTKISELRLFRNKITQIENLDHLFPTLRLLNIGKNAIEGSLTDHARYLRKFKNLRILIFEGNPCSQDLHYRPTTLSYVPHLRYLDYRLCSDNEKQAATEQFEGDVKDLKDSEVIQQELQLEEEKEKLLEKEDIRTNCTFLRDIYVTIACEDPELRKLSSFEGYSELMTELEHNLISAISDIRKVMSKHYQRRDQEHDLFSKAIENAKNQNDAEAFQLVSDFENEKKSIILKIQDSQDLPLEMEDVTATVVDFLEKNDQLNDFLVEFELELAEQNLVLLHQFDRNVDQMKKEVLDDIISGFSKIREVFSSFHDQVSNLLFKYFETFSEDHDDESLSSELRHLFTDKTGQNIKAFLQTSFEFREGQLDVKENQMSTAEVERISNLMKNLKLTEHNRNRSRISEIWLRKHCVEEQLKANGVVLNTM